MESILKIIVLLLGWAINKQGTSEIVPKKDWMKVRAECTEDDRALLEIFEEHLVADIDIVMKERRAKELPSFSYIGKRIQVLEAYKFIEKTSTRRWSITEEYKPHIPVSDVTVFSRGDEG